MTPDPEWLAFWTLDEHRGGPPTFTNHRVETAAQALQVVASGCAIATVTATIAIGLPHPGVVSIPLTDGPSVATRLVWREGDENPIVHALIDLATDMTSGLTSGSNGRNARHRVRRRGAH